MRAVAIQRFGGPEVLRLTDVPRPRAGRGEVIVRVVAAGVNPIDWKIREGRLDGRYAHAFPLVPGWDVAGVVEELGDDATRFRKGDRVWSFARKQVIQWGAYAEYIAIAETSVALMPSSLLFEEAAAFPLAALTAYQALVTTAEVSAGASAVVLGASGGVGHFAVQIAKHAGCNVMGTAEADHQDLVLGLGAQKTVDCTEDVREAVQRWAPDGADVVLDAVGGDETVRGVDLVKRGGMLVSVAGTPDEKICAERGIRGRSICVRPDADQLKRLAGLVERSKLRATISTIRPLTDAATAHEESQGGHVRGKLVLAL